jgi:hypothetical protein
VSDLHAVLIHLDTSYSPEDLAELEDKLAALVENARVGEFDGNEIGPDKTTLFLYGPDADVLFSVVRATVQQNPVSHDARVVLRYGDPGSTQREFVLSRGREVS